MRVALQCMKKGGMAKLDRKLPAIRIPILYLIISVLILVSVVPMYYYARSVMAKNRESLVNQRTSRCSRR